MIKSLICGTFVLLFVLVIAGQAWSAKPQPPGHHLNITEVLVDDTVDAEAIIITGTDLDFGPGPLMVTLGESPGDISGDCILTVTNTEITCDFSAGGLPDAGDYLLTVSQGNGQSQNDEYDLTIGAVGPEGQQGVPGITTLLLPQVQLQDPEICENLNPGAACVASTTCPQTPTAHISTGGCCGCNIFTPSNGAAPPQDAIITFSSPAPCERLGGRP